jgi:C4-dicarboxylate transporter DctQ subunit
MGRGIDRLSDVLAALAAVLFAAVGGMILFEVVARYVFNAPTIWAEELSRFAQLWATYLAAAAVLRHRELIRITLVTGRLGPRARRAAEVFALAFIAAVCLVLIRYGAAIAWDSIVRGRSSATMLDVPQWLTEVCIPVGFALVLVQALVEIARSLRAEPEALPPAEPPP